MTLKRCANCANGVWTCREQSIPEVCIKCGYKSNGDPSEWKPIKPTNADRIRAMSDEDKAREFVFFCPSDAVFRGEETYGKPHYTGLDGKYYSTSEEVICANLKWLKQPVEVDHE